jgi:cell wall-associated NlpC family hydrolase
MSICIPEIFHSVKYNYDRYPGVEDQSNFSHGANCQVFSYELLAVNGVQAPNLRSSNIWEDSKYTLKVEGDLKPLDLLLFNSTSDPYGAHMAVSLGGEDLIHLAKHNEVAEISTINELCKLDKYKVFLGAMRVK